MNENQRRGDSYRSPRSLTSVNKLEELEEI
jgi:hypothetical protein